jgi:hypothetical protein
MHELSPEAVKGILVNPIYTGVGPFPRLVEDEIWVRTCTKLIQEEGAEQFLVNLLLGPLPHNFPTLHRNLWSHSEQRREQGAGRSPC